MSPSNKEKVTLINITADHPQLPEVIQFSMGNPKQNTIREVIMAYNKPDHELIGVFLKDTLAGVVGEEWTIHHISILPGSQRKGLGTLLMNAVKERVGLCKIRAETDQEAVGFYLKCGFSCDPFQGKYGNVRYQCQ